MTAQRLQDFDDSFVRGHDLLRQNDWEELAVALDYSAVIGAQLFEALMASAEKLPDVGSYLLVPVMQVWPARTQTQGDRHVFLSDVAAAAVVPEWALWLRQSVDFGPAPDRVVGSRYPEREHLRLLMDVVARREQALVRWSAERRAKALELALAMPQCFTCGTWMRLAGTTFVCEGCGSTGRVA